jgi:hypothetical protein
MSDSYRMRLEFYAFSFVLNGDPDSRNLQKTTASQVHGNFIYSRLTFM